MYDIETTCCFTGKRAQFFSFMYDEENAACRNIKYRLRAAIEKALNDGYRHFISGMALGCDIWAAEILLELKQHYTLTLEGAVPFAGQPRSWPAAQRERYFRCLKGCDTVTILLPQYSKGCYFHRNRYMVDHAALLIAVTDGSRRGGTAYTIQYAQKQEKEIRYIPVQS